MGEIKRPKFSCKTFVLLLMLFFSEYKSLRSRKSGESQRQQALPEPTARPQGENRPRAVSL